MQKTPLSSSNFANSLSRQHDECGTLELREFFAYLQRKPASGEGRGRIQRGVFISSAATQ